MAKIAAAILFMAIWLGFLCIVAKDCSKSPSERDKDHDNFL